MKLPHIARAAGLGSAVLVLSAGAALAAVATTSVNVRTGPGTGYAAVDTLRPGQQVAIVDRDGGWCAVQSSGPDGWVSCRYLSNSSVRFGVGSRVDVGPNVSLSFGYNVRPDRPRRPPQMWWYDRGDYWDRRPSNSFSLSLGG